MKKKIREMENRAKKGLELVWQDFRREQDQRMAGREAVFKDTVAENFLELIKYMNHHIQEMLQVLRRIFEKGKRVITRYSIGKRRDLKATKREKMDYLQKTDSQTDSRFGTSNNRIQMKME